MSSINESEFNRIFLKKFFKSILSSKSGYPDNLLDDMTGILADLFIREFGSGNTPDKILNQHGNLQDWLEEKIENFNL